MPKVSIIVPVYNSGSYLNRCLDSLINQTLDDIEIIIVDDGSTDNSKDIINSYKDNRIKYFYKENGGQASARNLGLTKAKGEYIIFIDSDDYVESDMCEELYNTISKNKCDIVVCDYYIVSNDRRYMKIFDKSKDITLKEYLMSPVCPWNKIYLKDFLINNNFKFPEGIICEDYAIIPTLVNYKPKIYYLNKAFVNYVHTDLSTMRSSKYKKKYEDIFKASDILYNNLINKGYNEEVEYLIVYHMLYLANLNFYKFDKYDQMDRVSTYIKEKFPNFKSNKYLKNKSKKEKLLMRLFYYRKYSMIKLFQKIKHGGKA